MNIKTIAIQSPGDMGHGVGRLLVEGGYRVSETDGCSQALNVTVETEPHLAC